MIIGRELLWNVLAGLTVLIAICMVILWLELRRRPLWPLTEDEQEQRRIAALRRENERAEDNRLKQIRAVAVGLRGKIANSLANSGFSYIYERHGATAKASKPRINHILYTKDALYFRIDRLPFRINFSDINTPEVARNLSLTIGRECRWLASTQDGLWLQVELATGLAAVPRFVPYYSEDTKHNAVELLPKTNPFTVAIGMGENRKLHYLDIRDAPHLLVAGATGGGKSNFLRQMLCTLITNVEPERLEVTLIDLKGGLEFWNYREVPHVKEVIIDREVIPDYLRSIIALKEARFSRLREAGFNNISGWNANRSSKMNYHLIIFDEIAGLMLDRKIKGKVDLLVEHLTAQGRAVGIHLVLCTQSPTRDVLSTIIRTNIPTRIMFTSDMTGSMIVLDNAMATNLPHGGRAIYRHIHYYEVQVPYILDGQVEDAIQNAINPNGPGQITPYDLFRLAWLNLEGKFSWRAVKEQIGNSVGHYTIKKWAKEFEYKADLLGPVIDLGNEGRFILLPAPASSPKTGRRLYQVNGSLPATVEDVDSLAMGNGKRADENGTLENGRLPEVKENE
jgi:hypothetical protein